MDPNGIDQSAYFLGANNALIGQDYFPYVCYTNATPTSCCQTTYPAANNNFAGIYTTLFNHKIMQKNGLH